MMAEPNRFAVAGRKGGIKRRDTLDQARRREIATDAAVARWSHPKPHEVIKLMLEAISLTGKPHCLFKRESITWFAAAGNMEEGRWMRWCVGTYSLGASFSDVIEDVVEV